MGRTRAWAATTALAALVLAGTTVTAGCTADDHPDLLDTASVLFPVHAMRQHRIEDQKAAFRTRLAELDPAREPVLSPTQVRLGPGETYDVLDLLLPGTDVVVTGQVGHWLRLADDTGYVSALQLRDAPWETTVVGEGEEELVDSCPGGLVDFTRITADVGRPYYVMHSFCGGEPVLRLQPGDQLVIDGETWTAVAVHTFPLAGNASVIEGLEGDAFLHSCDIVGGQSVVVSIKR